MAMIVLLVSLAALAASVYSFYEGRKASRETQKLIAEMRERRAEMIKRLRESRHE